MLKKLTKRIFGKTTAPSRPEGFFLKIRCKECGETFNLFINKSTELCQEFDDEGHVTYLLNKEIVGGSCRNRIQVRMDFNSSKDLLSRKIEKGEFLD